MSLTAERLHELLSYDPATGIFRWLVRRGPMSAGAVAGSVETKGYIQIVVDGQTYMAHRLAWLYVTGEWPENEIDHENLDKADNRWNNLRDATNPQNQANKALRANNTSGFKGVSWHAARRRWRAQIQINGKPISLGLFDTPEAAAAAYAAASVEHYGEFSRTA